MVVGYGVADVVLLKMDDRVAIYSMVIDMDVGDVSCQRACVHPPGKLLLPKPLVSLALPSYRRGFLGYEMIPRLLEGRVSGMRSKIRSLYSQVRKCGIVPIQ